ncbi:MAG: hypothetical protein LUG27_05450 [Clostridiales bacterium]|nr:hypothetical protein [Clostridiales bacterium]
MDAINASAITNLHEAIDMIETRPGGEAYMRSAMAMTGRRTKEEAMRDAFSLGLSLAEDSGDTAAWLLENGNYMTLVMGCLGYEVCTYDSNYRCIDRSGMMIAVDDAGEEKANIQERLREDGISEEVDYETLMAAVEAVSQADAVAACAAYEKMADIMMGRIDKEEADGTGRNLAWELEDGRYLVLQACELGYYAYVLDKDCRDSSPAAVVPCWSMDWADEALLEHAAGSINEDGETKGIKPVETAGARPVDYYEVAGKYRRGAA